MVRIRCFCGKLAKTFTSKYDSRTSKYIPIPIPNPKYCRAHGCEVCSGFNDLDVWSCCSNCKIKQRECFLCGCMPEEGTYFCKDHTCSFCDKGAEKGHCMIHAGLQQTLCKYLKCIICRTGTITNVDKCKLCSRHLVSNSFVCPSPRCPNCSCRVCPEVRIPGKDLCQAHCCPHCNRVMIDGRCFCMCTIPNCRNPCKPGSIECDSHKCSQCKVTSLSHGHCSTCQCQHCNNIKLPGRTVCVNHWCSTCQSVNYPLCNCFCMYCTKLREPGQIVCSDHCCKTCLDPFRGECKRCKCDKCTKIGNCPIQMHKNRFPAKFMCRSDDCGQMAREGSRYCDWHS